MRRDSPRSAPPYPALGARAAARTRPAPASQDAHALPRAPDRGRGEGARHGGRVGCCLGGDRPCGRRRRYDATRALDARRGCRARCGRRQLPGQARRAPAAPTAASSAAPGRRSQQALVSVGPRHVVAGGGDRDGARRSGSTPAALRACRSDLPDPPLPRHALPLGRARRRRHRAGDRPAVAGVEREGRRGSPDRSGGERRSLGRRRFGRWLERRRTPSRPRLPAIGPAPPRGRRARALVKVGIVGLPNAGYTTLFNAFTRAAAETATYPFTTVEPNVAIVEVPDERLGPVADAAGASPAIRDTI